MVLLVSLNKLYSQRLAFKNKHCIGNYTIQITQYIFTVYFHYGRYLKYQNMFHKLNLSIVVFFLIINNVSVSVKFRTEFLFYIDRSVDIASTRDNLPRWPSEHLHHISTAAE